MNQQNDNDQERERWPLQELSGQSWSKTGIGIKLFWSSSCDNELKAWRYPESEETKISREDEVILIRYSSSWWKILSSEEGIEDGDKEGEEEEEGGGKIWIWIVVIVVIWKEGWEVGNSIFFDRIKFVNLFVTSKYRWEIK